MKFPEKLKQKLNKRKEDKLLRKLDVETDLVDFSSNDYLGFAKNSNIFNQAHQFLITNNYLVNGATGSRLLSGNYSLYQQIERELAVIHKAESALIFNAGYNANIGFFSSVPQRTDVILYDEYIHASIREGILLSNAKSYKFKHQNLEDLIVNIKRAKTTCTHLYVVTESVFSMDGDTPDLKKMVAICKTHNAYLIVDEAHAVGVFDTGLIEKLDLQDAIFARIITFGKGLGCHGAVVLGSIKLKEYLTNFARSFIYTTALPPHCLSTIKMAYKILLSQPKNTILKENIAHFIAVAKEMKLQFIPSCSAIQCCIIKGNKQVKLVANFLKENGFNVKPILSPTVAKNAERLRFCLHSYNTKEEITQVLKLLKKVLVS